MYESRDASGRQVSLLCDTTTTTSTATTTKTTFTKSELPSQSRPSASSISSTASREGCLSSRSSSSGSPRNSHSPPTPPLVRLHSQSSLSQSTPSPMTPQYGFEPMDQQMKREQHAHPYYNSNYNHHATNVYPSISDSASQAYYHIPTQHGLSQINEFVDLEPNLFDAQSRTLQPLQTQLQNATYPDDAIAQLSPQAFQMPSSAVSATTTLPPLSSAPSTATVKNESTTPITTSDNASASASSKTPASKKKYPCPHATRFACTDTFTTSGHAARHGKKHTGEKNILCPTCNKAFTRKDNMKQHERTHKGGSRSGSVGASPIISNKGSRKGSTADSDAMDVDDSDLNLNMASGGVVPKRPKMQRSELSEIMEGITKSRGLDASEADVDPDGEGESPGLDALATAASELA